MALSSSKLPPLAERLAGLEQQATDLVSALPSEALETINSLRRQVDDLTKRLATAERELADLRSRQEETAAQHSVQAGDISPPAREGSRTPGTSPQNGQRPQHIANTPRPGIGNGLEVISIPDESSDEASQPASASPEPVLNRNGKRVPSGGLRRQSKKAKRTSAAHAVDAAYNIDKLVYRHHTGAEVPLCDDKDLAARLQKEWPDLISKKHIARFRQWLRNRTPGYCVFGYILKKKRTTNEGDAHACGYCVANGYPCVVSAADGKKFKLLPAKSPMFVGGEGDGDVEINGVAVEPHFEYF